ncbi:MAG: ATP-binding protein, partial [Flavihumibacter sp.]|nr:ATP-binding protein [Flavihumibacter sp.]
TIIATSIVLMLFILLVLIINILRKKQIYYKEQVEFLKLQYDSEILNSELEIQEQTMLHISREIHDNIGLSLSTAKLHLNAINWQQELTPQNKVREAIELMSKAMEDMSLLTKKMNTEYIRENGLLQAIQLLCADIKKIDSIRFSYLVEGEPVFLDAKIELLIFRIIQEAISNSIKHAEAGKIDLHLNYNHKALSASVKDDGVGFDTTFHVAGTGLNNIKQRTKLINGNFSISSTPFQGTVVTVVIPY